MREAIGGGIRSTPIRRAADHQITAIDGDLRAEDIRRERRGDIALQHGEEPLICSESPYASSRKVRPEGGVASTATQIAGAEG